MDIIKKANSNLNSLKINVYVSPDKFNENFVNNAQSLVNQFGTIPKSTLTLRGPGFSFRTVTFIEVRETITK